MSNKEKFEGMKRGLVENNERKYGAEARDRWGNAAAEDANRKMLKLSKAQFDRFQSLEREISSALGRAGDDRLAPRPAAPGAPHAPRAEVALAGLDLAVEGAVGLAGLRNAGAGHAVVAVGRVAVEARRGAAESAVTSARNSLGSSPNLRSERCEFLTYSFFGAFLLLMA